MKYNWQLPGWPVFSFDITDIQPSILAFAKETGEITGMIQGLPNNLREETLLQLMMSEALKTSEIEGEYISREDVLSSLRNNLGMNDKPVPVKDRRATGIAQLMTEVRKSFQEPLTINMLKTWHGLLMGGTPNINPGEWRKGNAPMQVISGPIGREVVHYEAPPSEQVPTEMEGFIEWYSSSVFPLKGEIAEGVLRSAIAHLYFESIHPFEDGNGRIGRAVAEKALSQSLDRPVMLSLSKTIEKNKKDYYSALKDAQRSLNITPWIHYFTQVILDAQRDAKLMVQFTLKKARFFDHYGEKLNERQSKAVLKVMEQGVDGFEGGMTAKKYMSITRASKATATRDLQQLYDLGVFTREGGGRSVRYHLNLD